MAFYACFQSHDGFRFRLDTRIYLRDEDSPDVQDTCVAAIIGKNPGSAAAVIDSNMDGELSPMNLCGDKLLPYVRNRFRNAYSLAKKNITEGSYVQVLNLFYLCDPNCSQAIRDLSRVDKPLICDKETNLPEIVWFAWGGPCPGLDQFKDRFIRRDFVHPFYFDSETKTIIESKPNICNKAKHTQGLPADPIEKHLKKILSSPGMRP